MSPCLVSRSKRYRVHSSCTTAAALGGQSIRFAQLKNSRCSDMGFKQSHLYNMVEFGGELFSPQANKMNHIAD